MHHSRLCRLLALLLAVCVLPSLALADTNDGTPVTRSAFTLTTRVNAAGFPADTEIHAQDWQFFLEKLAFSGVADAQSFLSPYSRVYFSGGLFMNGESVLPFEYDGYYSFRYVRSPALNGDSIHFQMFNFLQFMLKGYYFMELPTQLVALVMYPEATTALLHTYAEPIRDTFGGTGARTIPYEELLQFCERLDVIAQEDPHEAIYYYVTSLLTALDASDMTMERLSCMEDWLSYLDPEEQGMTITPTQAGGQSYELGGVTLLETSQTGFTLHCPDAEGYVLDVTYENAQGALTACVRVTLDADELFAAALSLTGLPTEGWLTAEGTAELSLSGSALAEEHAPVTLAYRMNRTAAARPYDLTFDVDWLHPETGLPAVGMTCRANVQTLPPEVLIDRPYDDQDDFFHLNSSLMDYYMEEYFPPIIKSLLPVLLQMPGGAFNDAINYLSEIGILSFLGFE